MKEVREFLRNYFNVMDVPDNEDSLIKYIVDKFTEQKAHFEEKNSRYDDKHKYPDHALVQSAITLMNDVLSQQKDNIALVDRLIKDEAALDDNKEEMHDVEGFFSNQVGVFDAAVKLESDLHNDLDYLASEEEANAALDQILLITMMPLCGKYNYKRIPELNGLMATVKAGHDKLLEAKRTELLEIVRQCMAEVHQAADGDPHVMNVITEVDAYFTERKEKIANTKSLALLDGLVPPMWARKDAACEHIENMLKPKPPIQLVNVKDNDTPYVAPKKVIKAVHRQAVFPSKLLENNEEIDMYVEKMRIILKQYLKSCDGIQLN
jgi:hypothetical protein